MALHHTLFTPDEVRDSGGVTCDPELFVLLMGMFNAGATGQAPIREVVVGQRENARHFKVSNSPFNQGMVAVLAELKARAITGPAMSAYLIRTMSFLDILRKPDTVPEFVRRDLESGRISFSESLMRACAVADVEFPDDDSPRLNPSSVVRHAQEFEAMAARIADFEAAVPESSCSCGSGRKAKNCCLKRSLKPRSTSLMVSFKEPVTISGVGVTSDGAVRFMTDGASQVETSFIETTYERAKGKKVVNRSPVDPSSLSISLNGVLRQYETIFALDTNTRKVAGMQISVAGIVLAKWRASFNGMPILAFGPTQAIELRDVDCSPDLVAWRTFLEVLEANPDRRSMGRVAVIVDSHLNALNAMNARKSPILDDYYLPAGFELTYASSDVGVVESVTNKLLALADRSANDLLNQLGQSAMMLKKIEPPALRSNHATYVRIWNCGGPNA